MSRFKRPRSPTIREQCDHCRHFTGILSEADGSRVPIQENRRGSCRVNVRYDDVCKQGARSIALPCFHPEFGNMPHDGSPWPTCEHISFKTTEELDAEDAEIEEQCAKFLAQHEVVRPAILKHIGVARKPVNDCRGKMPCPICGGELHYSVSAYNGHVHAKCLTEDCVSFME